MIAKHGDALSFEALGEMEVLQRNIKEALRIHPPLVMLLRYVKAPFTVTDSKGKDFVIPKVCLGKGAADCWYPDLQFQWLTLPGTVFNLQAA